MRSGFHYFLLASWAASLVGCALPAPPSKVQSVPTRQHGATRRTTDRSEASSLAVEQSDGDRHPPVDIANQPATSSAPANNPSEPASASLIEMIEELNELGALDPEAHQRLMSDLKQVDPALWPAMVSTLKAGIAYRQRQAEKLAHSEPNEPATKWRDLSDDPLGPSLRAPATAERAAEPRAKAEVVEAFAADEENLVEAAAAQAPVVEPAMTASSVQPAGYQRQIEVPLTFEQRLQTLILDLETRNVASASTGAADNEIHLRLLYLLAGRREDALRPIAALTPAQQEFWTKQLYGLGTLLDTRRLDDQQLRAAEAALHLSEATARLRDSAALVVRSLAFCTEVNSYGVYKPFEQYVFLPGQEVLLYAEIENFKSTLGPDGYRTSLNSRYQIFDKQGQQVDQRDFGSTEELCRNRRRDFFIRYQFALPERLYDGAYTLKLIIEDAEAEKVGESSIDFTIKESAK